MLRRTLLIALSGLATTALADNPTSPPARVSPACRAEVMALCPKSEDRAARRDCMIINHTKLSPSCVSEIKAARDRRKADRTPAPTVPSVTAQ